MMGLCLAASGTGCSDDSQPEDSAGADAATGGALDGPAVDVGQFSVQLNAPQPATETSDARPGSTTIQGTVGDKPVAEPIVWELRSEAAGCRLLVPRVPFCEESCGSEVCVEDDTCEPNRMLVDVGTVTVQGVTTDDGEDEVVLTAVRNNYQNGVATLPYPAFAEGDAITLRAAGAGAVPAFEITARGIATLEVPDGEYVLADGQTLALHWTPAGRPELSRIQIKLDVSHHGGTKGKIECDLEDSGEFTLPVALTDELLSLGVAGFPSVVITRRATAAAQLPMGRVQLLVYEYAERFLTIPGVISCTGPGQCPGDQVCRDDKTCG